MAVVKLLATLSSYGRRAVVVGGVADRYASELARAGQSNRRRAGTGSASLERATRPPLWPAGMAEGNRATFGPRVGLSSHGSPAKGGPKSKHLARVKISQYRTCPAFLSPKSHWTAGKVGVRAHGAWDHEVFARDSGWSVFQCVAVPLVAQKSQMVTQMSQMVAQMSQMVAQMSAITVNPDRLADGHKSLIPKRLDCVP